MSGDDDGFSNKLVFDVPQVRDPRVLERAPTDGYEYLQQVTHEASRLKKTVTAPKPATITSRNHTPNPVFDESETEKPVKSQFCLEPTEKRKIVDDFSHVRDTVSEKLKRSKEKLMKTPKMDKFELTYVKWKNFVAANPPSVAYFLEMPQEKIDTCLRFQRRLLTAIVENDEATSIPYTTIENCYNWMYHLLVFKWTPLLDETCDLLRNIVRLITQLRNMFEKFEEKSDNIKVIRSSNLLICIISNYFGQKDLDES